MRVSPPYRIRHPRPPILFRVSSWRAVTSIPPPPFPIRSPSFSTRPVSLPSRLRPRPRWKTTTSPPMRHHDRRRNPRGCCALIRSFHLLPLLRSPFSLFSANFASSAIEMSSWPVESLLHRQIEAPRPAIPLTCCSSVEIWSSRAALAISDFLRHRCSLPPLLRPLPPSTEPDNRHLSSRHNGMIQAFPAREHSAFAMASSPRCTRNSLEPRRGFRPLLNARRRKNPGRC
mmetsp:Transcript_989/g.2374  ORF Transcript_989/g.2374 Transcript_989/m.2374 type:complete len:230 (-) Transcript_989:466-1155(-)